MDFDVSRAKSVRQEGRTIVLETRADILRGDMLLVATGRKPNVEGIGLDGAGVVHDATGIRVDRLLRTSVPHILAAGDVTGGPQFTHHAVWQCFVAVRNVLLPRREAGVSDVVPRVTHVDPEVAHVGLSDEEARAVHGARVRVHTRAMSQTDRAVCDGETDGFVKVVALARGRVLGATIVASRAGEKIGTFGLAIRHRLTLNDLAGTMHAQPTWSTALQQVASEAAIAGLLASAPGRVALRLSGLRGSR